jgi:hypothetical protein
MGAVVIWGVTMTIIHSIKGLKEVAAKVTSGDLVRHLETHLTMKS